MSVGELLTARGGLIAIGDVTLPSIAASYALAKAKRKANPELATIEEQRVALCTAHCVRNEDGSAVLSEQGEYQFADRAAFDAAFAELLAQEVTLTGVRAVTVAELEGAAVSPDVLYALGPFVVESA